MVSLNSDAVQINDRPRSYSSTIPNIIDINNINSSKNTPVSAPVTPVKRSNSFRPSIDNGSNSSKVNTVIKTDERRSSKTLAHAGSIIVSSTTAVSIANTNSIPSYMKLIRENVSPVRVRFVTES
jgi:hypothetical protein